MDMDEKKYSAEPSTVPTNAEPLPAYGDSEPTRGGLGQRIMDSFKRDPNAHVTGGNSAGADGSGFDIESAAQNTASSPLQRSLKGRHLQMIAIGGSIGTSNEDYILRPCTDIHCKVPVCSSAPVQSSLRVVRHL